MIGEHARAFVLGLVLAFRAAQDLPGLPHMVLFGLAWNFLMMLLFLLTGSPLFDPPPAAWE